MRLIAPLLLLLLVFAGTASATDYYVSTTGDNTTQGNITHPWQNVSYATQQATAGDTIYLFDGTWYNETCTFANSGNATHRITVTAYNGTPTLDGVTKNETDSTYIGFNLNSKDYITIDDLKIVRYYRTIDIPGSNVTISNCELADTGWSVVVISRPDSHYNTIENCTCHDSNWNTIQLYGNREPPGGNGVASTHITIRNCTIYNSTQHAAIDMYGNFENIIIEDCTFYNNPSISIMEHDAPDFRKDIIIRNCTFDNLSSNAIYVGNDIGYYRIYNNTFRNVFGTAYSIELYYGSVDTEIYDNYFYNTTHIRLSNVTNITLTNNYQDDDCESYYVRDGAGVTIIDPTGKTSVLTYLNTNVTLKFTDGKAFAATFGDAWDQPTSYTDVRVYPTHSNCSMATGSDSPWLLSTLYNITFRPTNAYLKNVSVGRESNITSDVTNITVNSSVSTNPTWINATMQNASANYSVSVDGAVVDYVDADADGIASYQYTNSWSSHYFEFNWVSAAPFSPDHAKAYYNATSPILNTVNSTEYVLRDRTVTEYDTVTSSGSIGVTI